MKKITLPFLFLTSLLTTQFFCTAAYASNPLNSDPAITAKVKYKLVNDPVTANSGIQVKTTDGKVTLSGNVKTATEVNVAVQDAESVTGVNDVDSVIKVAGGSQPFADSLITAKVKGAFIQHKVFGNQPISVTGVNVETTNGIVYLTGTVNNKSQAANAIKIANTVTGVNQVISKITVKAQTIS